MVQGHSLNKKDYNEMMKLVSSLSTPSINISRELQCKLSEIFGYHSTVLWKVDDNENLNSPQTHRLSDYSIEEYLRDYHHLDYLHPNNQGQLLKNKIALRLEDIIPLERYRKSTYYKEFMKKYNYYHEMVVSFYFKQRLVGVLGVTREEAEEGFSENDCHRFKALAPIIANFLCIEKEQEEERYERKVFEDFTNKSEAGLILLNKNYSIQYMNNAAWDIFRMTTRNNDLNGFLQKLLNKDIHSVIGSSKLYTSALDSYSVRLVSQFDNSLSHIDRFAIIIEKESSHDCDTNKNLVLHLTSREREVTYFLCKGYRYEEIAKELYISINTVKKHIKNIYQKTNVNSRASLQLLLQ
ncbi:hypothetical protein AJ85_06425 [Alkalihalobacillus alcalophilus ATCC 27647 = CGMCC 1.3604]|uniref:HTH luxR-type domain-containing protein n=1 Tax=Alkalihalobacillus alcalophilus ATCC 27647 = CGMCC 1.3604 TaxID=1218173 RepID=A0A094WLL4_ALKAL|nr:LuxR C-terminal-related transcriptional regulator [Alkalihalobacillus alcalophilus]KGA98649.1 hypothetical protein BALCAV_0203245 [Alkalihalobacillus alcalophilus ATCC 27647 = CGMCC 1.3604]MED1562426.1 LuxR C-terminal-related transcriptional regulator [Alkalihalobacillus alcalophilus]THG91162.1 hypothetical protein AJ85_06425 [Alkalihalobacillus alcalophilus ATCC 27647 = CGMCC 1.3604]